MFKMIFLVTMICVWLGHILIPWRLLSGDLNEKNKRFLEALQSVFIVIYVIVAVGVIIVFWVNALTPWVLLSDDESTEAGSFMVLIIVGTGIKVIVDTINPPRSRM